MALHAVDSVSDAFGATREFLLPFEPRRWIKLAIVALFVGGGLSLPTVQFDVPGSVGRQPIEGGLPAFAPDTVPAAVGVLVAIAVLLGVLYGLVGAIMEFVLVESLRSGDVSLRRYWQRRWRQGLRLFGFRLVIGAAALAVFVGWLGLFAAPMLFDGIEPIVPFVVLLAVGLPIVFLVGLLYALVASLTTVFVVPIMIRTDGGVLSGWRRLWRSIRSAPKQYLAYVLIGFVLTIATGLLVSFAVGIAAIALLIPVVVAGALVYWTVSFSSAVGIVILAATGGLFFLSIAVLWLFLQVPVLAYLRYYALFVLGDIEHSFDLVSEQRNAVRG